MLYLLLKPFFATWNIANLFHYITFRSGIAVLFSMVLSFLVMPRAIMILRRYQHGGQPIRDCGPDSHQAKRGTPTMGGIIIIFSILVTSILIADISNQFVLCALFTLLGFGGLGFYDDYLKIIRKNHHGLRARSKLVWQLVVALIGCLWVTSANDEQSAMMLSIPFLKSYVLNLSYFYIPFATLVIVGSSNAVNLTDGLDGLAIVPIGIVAGCLGVISYVVGHAIYSDYLHIIHVAGAGELCIVCSAIVGSSLGFLWYNAQPAEVFMGDTGSLALGGVLGNISVITKHELVLAILGGVFVAETLSVIIQVYYFRRTGGKRFFLMAPLHHHFEKLGWHESKIVIRFWIVSMIFAFIGLASLKLR
jgi:phospho-N-acetylmuramoyl-pentapeptide-transferase